MLQGSVPPAQPVRGRRDVTAVAVAFGIVMFFAVGVLKPWGAGPSPSATPSASTLAVVPPSQLRSARAAPKATARARTTDQPVSDDVWRRVGPALAGDAIVAAVQSGIVAIDPGSGRVRAFLVCECDVQGALAISPNGTSIAYGNTVNGVLYIRTVDIATGRSNVVTRCDACSEFEFDLSWSPDGVTLAFSAAASGIWTVGVDGSSPRHVLTTGRSPTFSPDGTRLLLDGTYTVNVDGTGLTRLPIEGAFRAAWSPDGSRLAYVTDPVGPSTQVPFVEQLWVADIDGSHPLKVAEQPGCCGIMESMSDPVWSPDGTRLVWQPGLERGLVVVGADGSSPRAIATGVDLRPVRPAWLEVPAAKPSPRPS